MSLKDLLSDNQKGNQKKKQKPTSKSRSTGQVGRPIEKDEPQLNLTIRTGVSTKELLLRIQKIKNLAASDNKPSQGDLVREGLELLAKKMKLDEKEKDYAKFLDELK